jgi:hypothetical protein
VLGVAMTVVVVEKREQKKEEEGGQREYGILVHLWTKI